MENPCWLSTLSRTCPRGPGERKKPWTNTAPQVSPAATLPMSRTFQGPVLHLSKPVDHTPPGVFLFRISAVGCMLSPCCGSFQASCSEWNGKVQTNPANLLARSINSTRPMLCATTLQARGRTPRHRSYKAIVKLWRNRGEGRSTTSELVSPN